MLAYRHIKWGLIAKLLMRAFSWRPSIPATLKLDSILSTFKCAPFIVLVSRSRYETRHSFFHKMQVTFSLLTLISLWSCIGLDQHLSSECPLFQWRGGQGLLLLGLLVRFQTLKCGMRKFLPPRLYLFFLFFRNWWRGFRPGCSDVRQWVFRTAPAWRPGFHAPTSGTFLVFYFCKKYLFAVNVT